MMESCFSRQGFREGASPCGLLLPRPLPNRPDEIGRASGQSRGGDFGGAVGGMIRGGCGEGPVEKRPQVSSSPALRILRLVMLLHLEIR